MGGRRIGVRWSRAGLDAELRGLAGAALGPHDAPPNVSIVVGDTSGRSRTKHHMVVQGELVAATASDAALVRAVIRALGALVAVPPPGAVALNAFALVDPAGAATIVDRRLAGEFRRLEPRLRRSGRRLVEAPRLHVRPAGATLALPDSATGLGVSLEALDRRWPLEGMVDDLAAGDLPVSGVVYAGRAEPESRAVAVADMVPLARDRVGSVRTVDVGQLAVMAEAVPTEPIPSHDRGRLRRALGVR